MKIVLLKDEHSRQAIVISLNERTDGSAYMEFTESDSAKVVATKLRDLAETIETEASKVG